MAIPDLSIKIVDEPNEITASAIKEGRDLIFDSCALRYSSMRALKEALEDCLDE